MNERQAKCLQKTDSQEHYPSAEVHLDSVQLLSRIDLSPVTDLPQIKALCIEITQSMFPITLDIADIYRSINPTRLTLIDIAENETPPTDFTNPNRVDLTLDPSF